MKLTRSDLMLLADVRRDLLSGEAQSARVRAGITQAELATVVGVSRSAVSLWEGRIRVPRGPAAVRYGRLIASLRTRQTEAGVA